MKSFGPNAKAYLPLSLVIALIGVQPAAFAGSALDPYAHIQAPESPAKKKQTSVPAVDNIVTPSTYVTMPMGGDPSLLPQQKKPGMFSGLKNPVAAIPNPFKGGGDKKPKAPSNQTTIVSQPAPAKKPSSPGLMQKSASMLSSSFKATGKMASASTSLIPGAGKGKKQAPKQDIANAPSGSLNEMYVNKAKANMAKAKENDKEQKVANTKMPSSTKDIITGQNGDKQKIASKKRLLPSVSVPFMKKKPEALKETSVAEANDGSGFYQGALDKKSGTDLKPSQELATTNSAKETPVVASSKPVQQKKKGLIPGMPKLKAPQLASIPFMGGKKKEESKAAPAPTQSQISQQHQIPVSPAAVSKPSVAEKAPFDPADPYPDVKPTSIAQHPGSAPAKKGGLLKMPSVKMPKIGIPGLGGKKAPQQQKREEVL
ncbi:MAG: hypothetical protein SFY67_03955 [Candidatus Melainabacteria bacterium]|nr:hypothetical protein [Candidatus Melainabacteria bacterium]